MLCFILFIMPVKLIIANNKVEFILDLLKTQTIPTNLIIWQSCFDDMHKLKLVRNSFTPTVFIEQDSLNASDFRENPQYNLFAVDYTCSKAQERIIQKVNNFRFNIECLSIVTLIVWAGYSYT